MLIQGDWIKPSQYRCWTITCKGGSIFGRYINIRSEWDMNRHTEQKFICNQANAYHQNEMMLLQTLWMNWAQYQQPSSSQSSPNMTTQSSIYKHYSIHSAYNISISVWMTAETRKKHFEEMPNRRGPIFASHSQPQRDVIWTKTMTQSIARRISFIIMIN